MDSTYFVGAILVWAFLLSGHSVRGRAFLLSGHSVRGRAVPMNEGLVSHNQNISVSARYRNNFTVERLPPSPRNSHDHQILALGANRVRHNISVSSRYRNNFTVERLPPSPRNSHDQILALGANRVRHSAKINSYGKYNGVLVSFSVHGVPVKANQISSAVASLSIGTDGPREQIESIQFGWHVWPTHYGDNDSHFFVYWTKDGSQSTGCFNLDCEGFIFDNQSLWRPGQKLGPLSERNGTQYYLIVRIAMEPLGRWYLYYGSEYDKPIGYWPLGHFNRLWDYGTKVDVGGFVIFTRGEPSPPMGSGFHPSDPIGKAAMIRAQIHDDGKMVTLPGSIYVDRGDCYSLARSNGDYYYGGPGGCTD